MGLKGLRAKARIIGNIDPSKGGFHATGALAYRYVSKWIDRDVYGFPQATPRKREREKRIIATISNFIVQLYDVMRRYDTVKEYITPKRFATSLRVAANIIDKK